MVIIVGLVWEPLVIQKDILQALALLGFGLTQTGVPSSAGVMLIVDALRHGFLQ
jgi:hypothetical protein